jgi:hypothetical protein
VDHTESWRALIAEIRQARDPIQSQATGRLYDLAMEEAGAVLARFGLATEDREEIVSDVFAGKLPALLGAKTSPRALFLGAIARQARASSRGGRVHGEERGPVASAPQPGGGDEPASMAIDAHRAVLALSARDRDVVLGVWYGEERDAVARDAGTTRVDVDRIVSRFRERWMGGRG